MSWSVLDRVARFTRPARSRWLTDQGEHVMRAILSGRPPWHLLGRPEQFLPKGRWRWWLINAGRGWGKTRTGAETVAYWARRYPGCRIALVAITFADGRDTMVEGESGLLSVLEPHELRGGTVDTAWNRSMGELFLANGTRFKVFSSERPRALRGPQHHFGWGDEPAYWIDADKGTARDGTWSNLNIGLRLPRMPGWPADYRARAILTTTPRRTPLLKVPDEVLATTPHVAGLLQRAATEVVVTKGRTQDNIHNLEADYRTAVIDPLVGTTLGRQELDGEMLEDVEGALWLQSTIDADRRHVDSEPKLSKRVLAFDPAGGGGLGHDEHGLIVAGATGSKRDLAIYVIADRSFNGTVNKASRTAILAYIEFDCHALVYEKNQGQDWIPALIEATWQKMTELGEIDTPMPRLQSVTATKSKADRARPQAALYEQHRVHHVGVFGTLEGQMTSWVPEDSDSPDRLDALVWALQWLWGSGPSEGAAASSARRERGRRGPGQPSSRLPVTFGARSRR